MWYNDGVMIRKTIIVVLTLAAAGTAVLSIVSKRTPLIYYCGGIDQPSFWKLYTANAIRGKLRIAFESLGEFVLITEQDASSDEGRAYPRPPLPPRPKTLRERLAARGFSVGYFAMWSYGVGEDKAGNHYQLKAMRRNVEFEVPAWFLIIVLASYPALACVRTVCRRRQYQTKHGLCVRCSYDLTGNESGVCPECGTPQ